MKGKINYIFFENKLLFKNWWSMFGVFCVCKWYLNIDIKKY